MIAANTIQSSFLITHGGRFCSLNIVFARDADDRCSLIFFQTKPYIFVNASVACAGAVPSELGKLSALEYLDMSANGLTGESVLGFGILKKSSLLACPYVVRLNRFLYKIYNERQFVYWSGVVIDPAPCISGGMVRLLIEKS